MKDEGWITLVKLGLALLVPWGIGALMFFQSSSPCVDTAVVGAAGWILVGALFFVLLKPKGWLE